MPKNNTGASYQELSTELDQLLAALQNPDVPIDEAVELYERGLQLVQQLEVHIKTAENKITKLKLRAAGEQDARQG